VAVGSDKVEAIFPVGGVRLSAIASGIRYSDRLDLVLIELAAGSQTAGIFTQNAFCAAPVQIAKSHLVQSSSRYFLVNTGNANAGTGESGKVDAVECCTLVAELAKVKPAEVLPFSTGVIGEPLPKEKILEGIPTALASLNDDQWKSAAAGIMTTDTRPKAASVQFKYKGKKVTISGIAKGSGMIKPNMATLLAFVFTDAEIEEGVLKNLLSQNANQSFNRITVDGDTSTNDCCMLVATGQSTVKVNESDEEFYSIFKEKLALIFKELATGIIKDAEGASKFLQINVIGGETSDECLAVAYTVAESPLVKTALFASDPNWGRILAAVGRAGLADLDVNLITIDLGAVRLVENGGLAASYTEKAGQTEMDNEEIAVTVNLSRGSAAETVWTSDLSHDYIRINAEYRT
jgi:glutamate N-acetyltransferase/amino-acid N-acetyltransferase